MINSFKQILLAYWPVVGAATLFLALTIPYWGEVPALDQLVIYRESIILFTQGFKGLIDTGYPLHPPLLYWLYHGGFILFGQSTESINGIGFLLYMLTVLGMYRLSSKILSPPWNSITSILFSVSPLLVLHSFYPSNDVLILCALVWGLERYASKDWRTLSVILALTALMKETVLVITIILLILSVICIMKDSLVGLNNRILKSILLVLPFLLFYTIWKYTLQKLGASEWRETSFGVTESNSFLVVVQTLTSGSILSRFFLGNLYNTFVMNFHWIVTETAVAGTIMYAMRKEVTPEQKRLALAILAITVTYIVTVFTFPTWTLARYGIPTFAALYLFAGYFLSGLKRPYGTILSVLIFGILMVSNLTSIDSLTKGSLPPLTVQQIDFYSTNVGYNGYTMVDYNMQYAKALQRQNRTLKNFFSAQETQLVTNCTELKVGEKIWTIQLAPAYYPGYTSSPINKQCTNWWEVTE